MSEEIFEKQCPRCGARNSSVDLPQREYRCADCGLELAHMDTNAQGAIRGILGWLLDVGVEINGRYRVTAVLGKGGFGVTYLVDDLRLHGKHRALKEIPESLFDEYETRLLGRLSHPAVPDITDRFAVAGMIYLVLEFGGSRTLRIEQERRGGRIPVFVLLPWIRQLCDALQYLHQQDPPVVHRDLKPDNILLDDNDRVMLIDFGIAKEATQDSVTRTLGRAVSHGFSPPEQVLGTGTDARSDVYALGAIIYNLLTNQKPAAAHERITGTVIEPLSSILPEIPPLIEAAVMKALELNINLRQQSIAELAQVFDLVQSGSGSAPTVSVAGIGTATAPTTSDQVVLPSVQLPSARSSATGSTQPGVRIQQAEAEAAPVKPPPKRSWVAVSALALSLIVAAGGGYWLLDRSGVVDRIAGGEDSASQPIQNDDEGPTGKSGDATRTVATAGLMNGKSGVADRQSVLHAESRTQVQGDKISQPGHAAVPATVSVPVDASTESTVESLRKGPAQAVQMQEQKKGAATSPAVEEATGGLVRNPATIEEGESTAAAATGGTTAAPPGVASQNTAGVGGVDSPISIVADAPTYAPSDLPSIFSSDQGSASVFVESDSGSSLLDVFEEQRRETLAEDPPVASITPTQPQDAEPAVTSKPKTTTKKTPKIRTKKTSKKRSKPKPAPSNASAWGFKYKGAEKR